MSEENDQNAAQDLGPLQISLGATLEGKLVSTIQRMIPDVDRLSEREKAEHLAKLAVEDWVNWINDEERHSRMDDLATDRIGELYAQIVEVVPSKDEIVQLFKLKPSLAKNVAQLFTQSPRPMFRRRVLTKLRDCFAEAIRRNEEPFKIQIEKDILDASLKKEEERLFKEDPAFEYRATGKALFGGSSEVCVRYKHLASARKIVAHLEALIGHIDTEMAQAGSGGTVPNGRPPIIDEDA